MSDHYDVHCLTAYFDRYKSHMSLPAQKTYMKDCACTTADYTVTSLSTMTVAFSSSHISNKNIVETKIGSVYMPDSNYPGLWIKTMQKEGKDNEKWHFSTDIWFVAVSEVNKETKQYDWAGRLNIFLLIHIYCSSYFVQL